MSEIEVKTADLSGAALRRLAEAAMPGDWFKAGNLLCFDVKTGESHGLNVEDDRFIASSSPAAVLSLLDQCDKAEAERDAALAELEALCIQVGTLTEWYSNALNVIAEVTAAIPVVTYMDPPDGGDVSIPEQIQRMAKDSERYRWIREQHNDQAGKCWVAVHQKAGWVSLDSAMLGADRENDLDLDSAVRAAMSQEAPNA